jgi:hypothetical protein
MGDRKRGAAAGDAKSDIDALIHEGRSADEQSGKLTKAD